MKVVGRQPYAPAGFTPRIILVLIFRGWVNPRAHGSVGSFGKNPPVTSLGIEPETSRLVEQCLNHYATLGPIHYMFSKFFSRNSCRLYDSDEKYGGAREAADNMTHVRCMLDKWSYMRINTGPRPRPDTRKQERTQMSYLLFSTVTMLSWTRINVTLHVHFLSCVYWEYSLKATKIFVAECTWDISLM
jgi:hypothetical protein